VKQDKFRSAAPEQTTLKSAGFTLIEIMVVIAILALLAVMVVPRVFTQLERAQETRVATDIRAIENSLKFYKLDTFSYPNQAQGLQALVEEPSDARNWRGPYLDALPLDPWEQEYRYANPGVHGRDVEVFTYGADNAEGGEGADTDWGNWNIQD